MQRGAPESTAAFPLYEGEWCRITMFLKKRRIARRTGMNRHRAGSRARARRVAIVKDSRQQRLRLRRTGDQPSNGQGTVRQIHFAQPGKSSLTLHDAVLHPVRVGDLKPAFREFELPGDSRPIALPPDSRRAGVHPTTWPIIGPSQRYRPQPFARRFQEDLVSHAQLDLPSGFSSNMNRRLPGQDRYGNSQEPQRECRALDSSEETLPRFVSGNHFRDRGAKITARGIRGQHSRFERVCFMDRRMVGGGLF
jgi:hypothetical protein